MVNYGELVPSTNTKVLLHLNGNVTDSSANGYNGTIVGVPNYVNGIFGQGIDSGTSNSTKRVYNTTNLGINGGACTISAWIKVNGNHTTSDHPLAVNEYCGSNAGAYVLNGIGFNQTNTAVVFSRLRTAIAWQDASYTFTPGTGWNYYTYTYDGTNIRGYVNGKLVVTAAASGNGTTETRNTGWNVLGSDYVSGHRFSGGVDEAIIENRAWSATEVLNYYNQSKGVYAPKMN